MARTGFFRHIGTFLLLSATVLLIVTSISAPVVHKLALLKVEIGGDDRAGDPTTVAFGTFGYCENNVDGRDICSRARVGYSPAAVLAASRAAAAVDFSGIVGDTTRALTHAMVLHPVAAGVCFIAFLLALGTGTGTLSSLLASLVALLAFLVTAVACVIDFVLFAIVRANVNGIDDDDDDDDGDGAGVVAVKAYYSAAAWTVLAAAACALLGAIVVFSACCSARLRRRRAGTRSATRAAGDDGVPAAKGAELPPETGGGSGGGGGGE